MANEEIRETVVTKLARLEEIIKAGFAINEKSHNEIKSDITTLIGDIKTDISTLTEHVNEENEKMDFRISKCEDYQQKCENEKSGQINVYKYATAILALAISILTILKLLGRI